jgi:hypothetical protein
VQQFEDIMAKTPNLDAFIPTGGFPQFIPDANRAAVGKYKDKIASKELALVVADTLPVQIDQMKEGPVARPGRPASVRDGLQDHVRAAATSRTARRLRPIRPIPASTSARRRRRTPASRSSIRTQHPARSGGQVARRSFSFQESAEPAACVGQ